jgi:putative phosphoesterase
MKVCIVSDSHDRAEPLAQAVQDAKARGAQAVIHCGDLIGTQTLRPTLAVGLPVHIIHGNNIGDPQSLHRWAAQSHGQLQYHGVDGRIELGGRRIILVHYDDYGYAMACTGLWDLVCCGHSHRAEARQVPNVTGTSTWLVNPGTVAGLAAPATWVLGDLTTMHFEVQELGSPSRSTDPSVQDRPTSVMATPT